MKTISVSYACTLFVCVLLGIIFALMREYSFWWGMSSLFLLPFIWVLSALFRDEIPVHAKFSAILFTGSFITLFVVVMLLVLFMRDKSFVSLASIVSAGVAILATGWLMSMVPCNSEK